MWDLVPWLGIELGPPALDAWVLRTGTPGKSLLFFFNWTECGLPSVITHLGLHPHSEWWHSTLLLLWGEFRQFLILHGARVHILVRLPDLFFFNSFYFNQSYSCHHLNSFHKACDKNTVGHFLPIFRFFRENQLSLCSWLFLAFTCILWNNRFRLLFQL